MAKLMITLLLILVSANSVAEPIQPPSKASFDELLQTLVAPDQPGVSVVISQRGQVIYQAARGLADVASQRAIAADDLLLIGSITKQYSAAALLTLAAEGKLSLCDSVGRLLDDQRF